MHYDHSNMRLLKLILVNALMLGLFANGVARADTITCRFDVNDVRQLIEIRPVDDVYTFGKIVNVRPTHID